MGEHILGSPSAQRECLASWSDDRRSARRGAGVRLGRPPTLPQAVVRRIQRQRARGDSLRAIAESLNAAGTPTVYGGKQWYVSTVRAVLARTG